MSILSILSTLVSIAGILLYADMKAGAVTPIPFVLISFAAVILPPVASHPLREPA